MVRDHGHVIALEQLVLAGHDTSRPHRRKERIPPGTAARAAAEQLRARQQPTTTVGDDHADVVIDLSKYDRAATGRTPSHDHRTDDRTDDHAYEGSGAVLGT